MYKHPPFMNLSTPLTWTSPLLKGVALNYELVEISLVVLYKKTHLNNPDNCQPFIGAGFT
ncbi:hypothetical protein GCM10011391_13540 [Pullulanibacillus camelliae]|uniref:Uncharacterized protein n=1 Tax=Pullulanibacillus camelliae TaxID=1707096 RepID=A0A8J2VUL2_9BACL|nr:hypothetical protein GCM10011391_13540 [Pullulanibacillus camelliae]